MVEHACAEIALEVAQKRGELGAAIERSREHQRAAAITKYGSQPVARLDQPFDEDDIARVDLDPHGELPGSRLLGRHHELLLLLAAK